MLPYNGKRCRRAFADQTLFPTNDVTAYAVNDIAR